MLKLCHNSTVVGVPSGCSGILGPTSHLGRTAHFGPILCKYANCISSYRLRGIMLTLCHNITVVGVPSGCSGILDPRSISWNHAKCFFSYRLYGTMLKHNHNSTVVGVPSGCSRILSRRSHPHLPHDSFWSHFMKSHFVGFC